MVRKIVIDNAAKLQLQLAYNYIFNDSPQNAEKFRDKVLSLIKELVKNPEKYPPDKYKVNNDGSFRACEVYKYRISYHVSKEQIVVLRIRHTKMNPLEY